jgi:glycosyltransferase involved in cell wall biosynthesis
MEPNRRAISDGLDRMTERRLRLLLVSSHPVQYATPIFRLLAQDPRVEIQVAYCSLQGVEPHLDPGFGVQVKWDVPLLDGYSWVLVPNRCWTPRVDSFLGLFNPGIWRLIRRGNFDAVVLFTGYIYVTFWVAIAATKISGIPVLFGTDATTLRARDGKRWKLAVKKFLLPAIFRLADVVIIPSEASRQFILNMGIPTSRVFLTPFVVDNDWWERRAAEVDRDAVRRKWDVPEEAVVALFCAKLQPWKRPLDALCAFAEANVKDAYLVFAGDGPERASLEAKAKSLGVAERTRFLGFVNQSGLPLVYRSADLFILPSGYDPCPVVVCEAMLCGCPVALSNEIHGRFDLVSDAKTGFIYPCGDIEALAGVLRRVLKDRRLLRRMGEAARERMATWSPTDYVNALVESVSTAVRARRGMKIPPSVRLP